MDVLGRLGVPATDLRRAFEVLATEGVVVLTGAIPPDRADAFALYIDRNWPAMSVHKVFKAGVFSDTYCQAREVHDVRRSPLVVGAFRYFYSMLRGRAPEGVIPAPDGINVQAPWVRKNIKPWAHVDEVDGEPGDVLQGLATLGDSEGGFVCSPRSHLLFRQIKSFVKPAPAYGWTRIEGGPGAGQRDAVRELVLGAGGAWQIEVNPPPLSLTVWFNTLVHSAVPARLPERYISLSPREALLGRAGWRLVVYVSYRPASEDTRERAEARRAAVLGNTSTDHTGGRLRRGPSAHCNDFDLSFAEWLVSTEVL